MGGLLRTDAANGDPSIGRQHTRSYFVVEALGRYYFLRSRSWDFWAGVSAGLVVLNDSWTSNADNMPYEQTSKTGPEANTLGTEGFTTGLGLGAEWSFLHNWSFGPMLPLLELVPPQPAADDPDPRRRLPLRTRRRHRRRHPHHLPH